MLQHLRQYDQIQWKRASVDSASSFSRAINAHLTADEAAWFAKSADRALILQRLPDGDLEVRLPLALVDKQWQVIDEAQMSQAAMSGVIGKAPAVQGAGMLDKLKSAFRFGGRPSGLFLRHASRGGRHLS